MILSLTHANTDLMRFENSLRPYWGKKKYQYGENSQRSTKLSKKEGGRSGTVHSLRPQERLSGVSDVPCASFAGTIPTVKKRLAKCFLEHIEKDT